MEDKDKVKFFLEVYLTALGRRFEVRVGKWVAENRSLVSGMGKFRITAVGKATEWKLRSDILCETHRLKY